MKFQKLSSNSLRCIISREEMSEQGLKIDDLLDNKEKAEDFLRYVLDEARYAVDFRTSGDVLNVQISSMPDGSLSMMISDDADSAIRNILSEMKNHLKAFQDAVGQNNRAVKGPTPPPENEDRIAKVIGEGAESLLSKDPSRAKKWEAEDFRDGSSPDGREVNGNAVEELPLWVELTSLEACIHLAADLPEIRKAPSTLYKMNGLYFLYIDLDLTQRQLAGIVVKVLEYASSLTSTRPETASLKEHGKTLIREKALLHLSELR